MKRKWTPQQAQQSARAKRAYERSLHNKVQGTPKLTPAEMLKLYSVNKPQKRTS